MDESRKQFEEWITKDVSSEIHKEIILNIGWNDDYSHNPTRIQWQAWKASRQALEENP